MIDAQVVVVSVALSSFHVIISLKRLSLSLRLMLFLIQEIVLLYLLIDAQVVLIGSFPELQAAANIDFVVLWSCELQGLRSRLFKSRNVLHLGFWSSLVCFVKHVKRSFGSHGVASAYWWFGDIEIRLIPFVAIFKTQRNAPVLKRQWLSIHLKLRSVKAHLRWLFEDVVSERLRHEEGRCVIFKKFRNHIYYILYDWWYRI